MLDLRTLNFMDSAGIALLQRTSVRSTLEGWAFAVQDDRRALPLAAPAAA